MSLYISLSTAFISGYCDCRFISLPYLIVKSFIANTMLSIRASPGPRTDSTWQVVDVRRGSVWGMTASMLYSWLLCLFLLPEVLLHTDPVVQWMPIQKDSPIDSEKYMRQCGVQPQKFRPKDSIFKLKTLSQNRPNPLMLWNLLCKNYEMSLNTKVIFQNKSSVLWSGSSQGSEDFVYSHTNTHTHSYVCLLLEVIFCGYVSFNLHMKHYLPNCLHPWISDIISAWPVVNFPR